MLNLIGSVAGLAAVGVDLVAILAALEISLAERLVLAAIVGALGRPGLGPRRQRRARLRTRLADAADRRHGVGAVARRRRCWRSSAAAFARP